jgi:squalene-hopene/tetraprenyl-beta-curcumene cyclase
VFGAIDKVLQATQGHFPQTTRKRAIKRAAAFVTERLNGDDGLGAIFPAMVNALLMFDALGVPPDDRRVRTARAAVEKLLVIKEDEAYCQPCLSPVWDTALTAHTLLEVGGDECERRCLRSLEWLRPIQVLDTVGDWAATRPNVRPGGWAFQYANPHYPDLDDTAVVVMAMDRSAGRIPEGKRGAFAQAIDRATEWVVGMQSENGGWAAFDADNEYYYLNEIPFADHGALLDPPTEDVTARCVSMLAQLGASTGKNESLDRGIAYLLRTQREDGSWFGRWGMNYIYGTWSVLCALNAARLPITAPAFRQAVDWLVSIQNDDGGWGEGGDSYKLDYRGYKPSPSTASQTAWALLALMAAGEVDHPSVAKGVTFLLESQGDDGFWTEAYFTATGFPRVFYLRYHGYAKFFPLWALARYRNLKSANTTSVLVGM